MADIRILISQQKKFYKSIVSIYSPILKETVFFSAEGFYHLLYNSNRRPRRLSERYMKLKCLTYVPEVIKKCKSIFVVRKVSRKIKGKWKETIRWALVYEVKKNKKLHNLVKVF